VGGLFHYRSGRRSISLVATSTQAYFSGSDLFHGPAAPPCRNSPNTVCLRVCPERSYGIAQRSRHEPDGSEAQEREPLSIEILAILGKPSAAALATSAAAGRTSTRGQKQTSAGVRPYPLRLPKIGSAGRFSMTSSARASGVGDTLRPMPWAHPERTPLPGSRDVGLGALLLLCGERIEIDELKIVAWGIAIEPSAAMNVHQGLHTPRI
jgi:hypothetical protein